MLYSRSSMSSQIVTTDRCFFQNCGNPRKLNGHVSMRFAPCPGIGLESFVPFDVPRLTQADDVPPETDGSYLRTGPA